MMALREHFSRDDSSRHSEWLRQREWFIKARQVQERRDEIADKQDDEFIALATEVIMATEIQLREFEARLDAYEARLDAFDDKLDAYDNAITKALIGNSERLALLEQQIAENEAVLSGMLVRAYVMEDGRRIFKSEDGSYVIDEHGAQVGRDEVDFNLVDGPTTAETFIEKLNRDKVLGAERDAALEERRRLHDAQAKVDDAREKSAEARTKLGEARDRVAEGGLTVRDIEDLDAELEEAMPSDLPALPVAAVRNLSNSTGASSLRSEFSATANRVVNPGPATPTNDPHLQL